MLALLLIACLKGSDDPPPVVRELLPPAPSPMELAPAPAFTPDTAFAWHTLSNTLLATVDGAAFPMPVPSVVPSSLHAAGEILAWVEEPSGGPLLRTTIGLAEVPSVSLAAAGPVALADGWLGAPCDGGWCVWSLGEAGWDRHELVFASTYLESADLAVSEGVPFVAALDPDRLEVRTRRAGAWELVPPPPTSCVPRELALAATSPTLAWVELCHAHPARPFEAEQQVRAATWTGSSWVVLPPWSPGPDPTGLDVLVADDGTVHVAALLDPPGEPARVASAQWSGITWENRFGVLPITSRRTRLHLLPVPGGASLRWGLGAEWRHHLNGPVEHHTERTGALTLFETITDVEITTSPRVMVQWRPSRRPWGPPSGPTRAWSPGAGLQAVPHEPAPAARIRAPEVRVSQGVLEVAFPDGRNRMYDLPVSSDDDVTVLEGDPLGVVVCTSDGVCTRYRLGRTARPDASWRCGSPSTSRTVVSGTPDRTCVACIDHDGTPSAGLPLTRVELDCR